MIFWELSEAILVRLQALQSKQQVVVARLKLQVFELLPRLRVLMRLELLLLLTFSILTAS